MKKNTKKKEKVFGVTVKFNGGPGHWSFSKIEKTDEYPDVVAGEELLPDRTYYLLYCIWSTGDSFGHTDEAYCEAISIYPTFDLAKSAATAIRQHSEDYNRGKFKTFDEQYNLNIPSWDGWNRQITAPWTGYFERLDSVKVQSVRLNQGCFDF